MNAILSLNRTGCARRYLPGDFPRGAARKVSASVRRAYIPDTYAASGPNREPGRILSAPATEQPGRVRVTVVFKLELPKFTTRVAELRDSCQHEI
jgi:hypothetical protein